MRRATLESIGALLLQEAPMMDHMEACRNPLAILNCCDSFVCKSDWSSLPLELATCEVKGFVSVVAQVSTPF